MNAHVRRQPERGPKGPARKGRSGGRGQPQRRPNVVIAGLVALGGLAARYPSVVGGSCAFIVVFSFVAANALWYQPGGHPSPFLRTRAAGNSLGFSATKPEPKDVTTFLIERQDEEGDLPAVADVTPTATPGNSGLEYARGNQTYSLVWKTEKAWAGGCRVLTLTLADGTTHTARFQVR